MTTEDKLSRAVEFIRMVEALDKHDYDTLSLDDIEAHGYCPTCDDEVDGVELQWPYDANLKTKYIDTRVVDELKDKAWHVLADIAD